MKLLILALALIGCASVRINQTARFSPGVFNQIYTLAEQSFLHHTNCPLPRDVELTVKDDTLVELNRLNNIFCSDGLCIRQGLYDPATRTIRLAVERPDKRYVLFHELLHFFLMESPKCNEEFKYVRAQHRLIAVMEEDYYAATGMTEEQEQDYHWILTYIKELAKE